MRTQLAAVTCLMVTATACATTTAQAQAATALSGSLHGSVGAQAGRGHEGVGTAGETGFEGAAGRTGFEGVGAAGGTGFESTVGAVSGAGHGGAGAASRARAVSGGVRDVADPVRLRIPAIKLSTRVIPLRLDSRGRLIAPTEFDRVGWNRSGPEPGEKGVAVIAGHVDSATGPAVFYRLRQLRKGDRIHVDRADGSTVTFRVGRLARYPKSRIPDKEVYGPAPGPSSG
ncbi:sortase domain-bontaining protein [Nonomuraea thailandensis]